MKKLALLFLVLGLYLSTSIASADALNFQLVGVYPSPMGKVLVVDVAHFPNQFQWGWREVVMNIDGFNYAINDWNAFRTGPFTARAQFVIPNWYPMWHNLQMGVNFYTPNWAGYAYPTYWEYSLPVSLFF